VLRTTAGTALSAGLWPGALRAADAPAKAFRFLCVNDLHCVDEESGRWLETRVLPSMKAAKGPIDFCLVLGDLAEHGTHKELATVRDVMKGLGVPTHVVPGNHDYAADNSRAAYDELFPKSLNYALEHKGWQLVGFDSTRGTAYKDIAVPAGTLDWLDESLAKLDKNRPTIAFTHFPLGERVTYRPTNAEDVLRRFTNHNLRAVLSGHFHARTDRAFKGAALTTGPCCALKRNNHDRSPAKGYFDCEAKDGAVSRQFVEVPTSA
jgi:3',5'-cyclic AMP phosphodiesterase CpdA